MKIYKNAALLVMILLIISTPTLSYADGPFTKLGRGLTNVCTGWIELPLTIHEYNIKRDYMIGFFYGLPIGLVKMFIRTTIGLYETVTFALPYPNDYGTIVEPEFVLESPLEPMRE